MELPFECMRAQKWEFTDTKTGELKSGTKLWIFGEIEHDEKQSGKQVWEAAGPANLFDVLKGKLPANIIADGSFGPKKVRNEKGQDVMTTVFKVKSVKLAK